MTPQAAQQASLNNRGAYSHLYHLCRLCIAGTAIELFRLAGLGWEYLDKQHELAERVYGYPDSISGSIFTVNWVLLRVYSDDVEYAYGRQLPVCHDLRHPRNLPILRWFDGGLEGGLPKPELAGDYTAALDKLFLVTWALAKLAAELDEEHRLIDWYLKYPQWLTWTSHIWDWRRNTSQKRIEDTVQSWLAGRGWDTQGDERMKLVTEAEQAWQHAQKLVKDADARGDLQMAEWAVPEGDEWWRTGLDC